MSALPRWKKFGYSKYSVLCPEVKHQPQKLESGWTIFCICWFGVASFFKGCLAKSTPKDRRTCIQGTEFLEAQRRNIGSSFVGVKQCANQQHNTNSKTSGEQELKLGTEERKTKVFVDPTCDKSSKNEKKNCVFHFPACDLPKLWPPKLEPKNLKVDITCFDKSHFVMFYFLNFEVCWRRSLFYVPGMTQKMFLTSFCIWSPSPVSHLSLSFSFVDQRKMRHFCGSPDFDRH